MNFWELFIIAVGLSMDAFAVSICKGLSVRKVTVREGISVAVWFGGFQALMPLLGFFLGVTFSDFVSNIDHWIAFILLSIIGGNMVKEAFSKDAGEVSPDFSFKTMLAMAVATSIDAFAIGVTLAFLNANIWISVLLIGITTAAFSVAGLYIGNAFGSHYKSKAELAGGIILIIMGVKILIDHLFL